MAVKRDSKQKGNKYKNETNINQHQPMDISDISDFWGLSISLNRKTNELLALPRLCADHQQRDQQRTAAGQARDRQQRPRRTALGPQDLNGSAEIDGMDQSLKQKTVRLIWTRWNHVFWKLQLAIFLEKKTYDNDLFKRTSKNMTFFFMTFGRRTPGEAKRMAKQRVQPGKASTAKKTKA